MGTRQRGECAIFQQLLESVGFTLDTGRRVKNSLLTGPKTYYVYILTNPGRTTYIGITSDLMRRIWEHKTRSRPGFAAKHGVDQLIYYEEYANVDEGIAREKQLKNWRRSKKIALISKMNPEWRDLAADWFE